MMNRQKFSKQERGDIEVACSEIIGRKLSSRERDAAFDKEGYLREFPLSRSIVEQLCQALTPMLHVEGIFRVSGSHVQTVALFAAMSISKGDVLPFALSRVNAHVLGGVLKLYMREQSLPLISSAVRRNLVNAARMLQTDSSFRTAQVAEAIKRSVAGSLSVLTDEHLR
jgi:hypothetical protein